VDKRRFGIILLLVAAGLGLLAWQQIQKDRAPGDPPADEQTRQAPADTQPPTSDAQSDDDPAKGDSTETAEAEDTQTADSVGDSQADADDQTDAATPEEPASPQVSAARPRWQAARFSSRTPALGSLSPDDGYKFQVTFDNRQAGIREVKLVDYFETVHDKQLWEEVQHDQAAYAEKAAQNPELYQGHYKLIRPVDFRGVRYLAMETRDFTFTLGDNASPVSLQQAFPEATWRYSDRSEDEDSQSITFTFTVEEDATWNQPGQPAERRKVLTLYKTYTIHKGSFSIDVSLRMENHTDADIRLSVDQVAATGVPQAGYRNDERQVVVAKLDDGAVQANKDADVKKLIELPFGEPQDVGSSTAEAEPVVWVGLVNKYFGSVVYPRPKMEGQLNAVSYTVDYYTTPIQEMATGKQASGSGSGRTWLVGARLKDLVVEPAGTEGPMEINFDVFAGPKKRELFRETPLYAQLKYSETITARSCVCPESLIAYLRRGLLWLLGIFSSFLFDNYGLAIMLLVAVVRLILHPLTKKGQVMMAKTQKKMAALKPQLDRIREKYANDKAAQQRETMKLYKEHGTGMGGMLGCLPMMLQMPIWIALFSGLNSSVELRHAAFLPVWITDLSVPDQLFTFGTELPLMGSSFNLLPLLLGVSMYFQSKLNPSMSGSASAMSPEQEQQQKMMRLMMPVMMLFFFYHMPSGLNLYIMASTTVGVVEQYFIRKHIREQEELEEAGGETTIKAPGKGPRNSRAKKPKGPFWTKRG
jgi:YidC/Oxa1 family membrane protein insertase